MKTSLHGPESDVTMNVWTWTPPEYDDPTYAGSGFPVLVLFPGGEGNNYNTWVDNAQLGLQTALTDMAKTGKSHPFILVMPSMQLSKGLETECSDIPGQPKVGTWITEDVRDMVLANFRANPDPKAWGIMGGSSGGFCAAKLALQRPDRFAAAVPIGAYFIPDSKLWHGKGPEWEANNPSLLAGKAGGPTKLLLVVGGNEPEERRVADNFAPLVKPPAIVERWDNPGGRHLTRDFKKAVPLALEFFTRNLPGPTPPPAN
ncbi:alpha/beta hydrolase [Uniformispora flossi]|uniref:alpha/beta hydrolase n=1 Tax=Uniformispora flossi TaxID=3390723 RepID=UPI003C2B191C